MFSQRLACAALLLLATVFGNAATQVIILGTNLNPGASWTYYNASDAPEGAWLGSYGASSITATVNLGTTLAPGSYAVYIKGTDYDSFGTNFATLGGGSTPLQILSDRDTSISWSTNIILTSVSSATNIILSFSGNAPTDKYLFRVLYITSITNQIVLSSDLALVYDFTSTTNLDVSAATGGNLIPNSSFECGVSSFWRIDTTSHEELLFDLWATNVARTGISSLRMPVIAGGTLYFIDSNPVLAASNKQYTASVWARSSTGTNLAFLYLINTYNNPGAGLSNVQSVGTGVSVTTNWTLIKITTNLLFYPNSEIFVELQCQTNNGGLYVYFDDLMLIQGANSNWQAKADFEFAAHANQPSKVFWNNANTNFFTIRGYNASAGTLAKTINYETRNWTNAVVGSGTLSLSVPALTNNSTTLTVPTNATGHFRTRFWISGQNTDEEVTWVMTTEPSAIASSSSVIGSHVNPIGWQLSALQRLGIKWTRVFSSGAIFRWELAEPTEGTYSFSDNQISNFLAYGLQPFANLGENLPSWALGTTYIPTTNVVGTFQGGELVKAATATGRVSVVLFSTNGTGTGLQVTNSVGTWSGSMTGATSAATAELRGSSVFPNCVPLEKWQRFASNMITHYSGSVSNYEIWNEPDQDTIEIPSLDFYAEVVRIAAIEAKRVNTNIQVVIGGGVSQGVQLTNIYNRLPVGFTNFFDAWSVHHYPGSEGDIDGPAGKPWWNTETGVSDKGSFTSARSPVRQLGLLGNYVIPSSSAAPFYFTFMLDMEQLGKNFLTGLGYGASRYFYYEARQSNIQPNDWASPQYTMLDYDGSIKAKGAAFTALRSLFENAAGQGAMVVPDTNTAAFLFLRGSTPLVAMWSKSAHSNKQVTLANNITANDIRVYDMMGNGAVPDALILQYGRLPIVIEGLGSLTLSNLNLSVTNSTIIGKADTTPPVLDITAYPRVVDQPVHHFRWLAIDDRDTIYLDTYDGLSYRYKLNSDTFTEWSGNTIANYSNLSTNQLNTFTVEAKDLSGNTATNSVSFGSTPSIITVTIGGNVTIGGKVNIQ